MVKATSIMMQVGGPEVCGQILRHMESYMLPPQTMTQGLPPPVHEAHLLYLQVLNNFFNISKKGDSQAKIDY
jgi:hypothetical protein